jgi:hypothetical protein
VFVGVFVSADAKGGRRAEGLWSHTLYCEKAEVGVTGVCEISRREGSDAEIPSGTASVGSSGGSRRDQRTGHRFFWHPRAGLPHRVALGLLVAVRV